ncbi:MAG TPA: hypothetical protein V6C97_35145 [Oculatellaceae cyanobacterium]
MPHTRREFTQKRIASRVLLSALSAGLQLTFMSTQALAEPETIRTETTTTGSPQVVKSYMVPTMMQTKETTDANGDTTKSEAPMIMERHEQVVVPQEKTTSETTIDRTPRVVEESIEQKTSVKKVPPKVVSHKRACITPKKHITHIAHHAVHRPRQIAQATNQVTVKRTVIEQPTIIKHSERTESNPITFERKDPALED